MQATHSRLLYGLGLAVLGIVLSSACTDSTENEPPAKEAPARSSSPSVSPSSAPTDPGMDWTRIVDEAEGGVVSISVVGRVGAGEGSGVIVDEEGHVLTNSHVVAAALAEGRVQVSLADARVVPADVVGSDPSTDLAVLKMTTPPEDLTSLEFGDSEALRVGQPVIALGNPLGLSHTVTMGIVSALDRPVTTSSTSDPVPGQSTPVVTNAIQTDAAVNPGNSGGALIDSSGRLVGINSSIATLGASYAGQGGSIGLGFAIPSYQAKWVAADLIESGKVDHAYLGVSVQDTIVGVDGGSREAARITSVAAGTPAAEAGLTPGDAIVGVDDEIVAGAEALVAQIRERPPGTLVSLTVVSDEGRTREIDVQFSTRPGP
jgi:putative serine protease PepD